ncbi:hypothetical protein DC843_26565 [Vibrio parahaemolyticus]|nr:hypothetical protein [Vibrio parahaemolyticus]
MWQSNLRKSWSRVSITYAPYRELTKHLRRIPNARHFGFASTKVSTAQCVRFRGRRCSPLNAALG